MATYVILRWPEPTDLETVEWVLVNGAEEEIVAGPERSQLSDCAARFEQTPIKAYVPSTDVLLLRAPLPEGPIARLQQAVPFVLEDQFAENVENLHFVLSPMRVTDECYSVAVVAHQKIKSWQDRLQAYQLMLDQLLPEVLALPFHEDAWTVFCTQEKAYIRQGIYAGFSIDIDMLTFALERSIENDDEHAFHCPQALYLYTDKQTDVDLASFCESYDIDYHRESQVESLLSFAETGAKEHLNWNLLSGAYRQTTPMTKIRRLWKYAGMLCLVWASVVLGGKLYHIHQLHGEYREYQADVLTLYQEVFPGAQSVNSPRALIGRELAAIGAVQQDLFLPLLTQIGVVLSEHQQIDLQTVNYQNERVTLTLQAPSFAALETLVEALNIFGLQVSQDSAVSQGTLVEARLVIAELN